MFKSLRSTLLVGQALILLAILAGFGTALFVRVRHATLAQIDSDLLGAAQSLASDLRSGGETPPSIPEIYRHRFGPAPHDRPYFVVWDKEGHERFSSAGVPPHTEPEARPVVKGPRAFRGRDVGPHRQVTIRGPGGEQILVGRRVGREHDQLVRLLVWTVVLGAGALLIGLLAAWFLARQITRPIDQMAATAERISTSNLDERISVPRAKNEIARLAVVLNAMFARLQSAFARQAQFTADASHELRTPVAVVMSHAEFALAHERSPEEYRTALEACQRASTRMKTLVDGLLTLARTDASPRPRDAQVVALRPLVETALILVKPLADDRSIALASDLADLNLSGDADRLHQVVTNLVANAIQYNRDGGWVRVTLARDGNQAVLTVADGGIGIARDELPKVFERFYRADPSRTSGGHGLGLAICREIVAGHGGTLELTSTPGQGTTATVRLPLDG